jgi:DNA-binding NarL/FixJ family response regulator
LDEEAHRDELDSPDDVTPPDNSDRRLTVCVLDDEEPVLGVLRRHLELNGFSARTVTTGAEALRVAAAESPDAVLVDLHLGDEDGIDVLPRLRASGYGGSLFVLSSDATFDAAHRAARAGADGYLVKDQASRLPERLRGLLEREREEAPLGAMSQETRAYLETRGLSDWETALAAELALDGASEKEIAARTGRSETAVRKGFETIRRKLGAGNQRDLARMLGVLSCFGGRR